MSKQAETNARNGNAVEPTKVAQVIADAFPKRTRYLVGRDAKLLAAWRACCPTETSIA